VHCSQSERLKSNVRVTRVRPIANCVQPAVLLPSGE